VDLARFIVAKAQPHTDLDGKAGRFALYRIGDAVAGRNIHAALCDAARLCSVL